FAGDSQSRSLYYAIQSRLSGGMKYDNQKVKVRVGEVFIAGSHTSEVMTEWSVYLQFIGDPHVESLLPSALWQSMATSERAEFDGWSADLRTRGYNVIVVQ